MHARLLTVACLGGLLACGDDAPPPTTAVPEILDVTAPTPMVEGTPLRLTVANLDAAGSSLRLQLRTDSGASFALDPEAEGSEGEVRFPLTGTLVESLGPGTFSVQLVLLGDRTESPPYPFVLTLTDALPIALDRAPGGSVHRNEETILEGGNFLEPSEGEVSAHFVGDFVPEGGSRRPVDVRLPVRLADESSRARGVVTLTTAIGGPEPGVFDGTLTLESRLRSGATSASEPAAASLTFLPPEIFEVTPTEVSLEQIVRVRGAGFLGGGDAVTLLRANGTLTPRDGSPTPVGPEELVLSFRSGSELAGPLSAVVRDNRLVSELFGVQRGRFENIGGQVLESRQVENHVVPRVLPQRHDHHREQGKVGIRGPVLGAPIAQELQGGVEKPVIWGEEEHPDRGRAYHWQHIGMEEGQTPHAQPWHAPVEEQGNNKSQHNAQGDSTQNVDGRVHNDLVEIWIREEVNVVAQPDERGFPVLGDVHSLAKETLIDGEQRGPGRKQGHEEDRGRNKKIGQQGKTSLTGHKSHIHVWE